MLNDGVAGTDFVVVQPSLFVFLRDEVCGFGCEPEVRRINSENVSRSFSDDEFNELIVDDRCWL